MGRKLLLEILYHFPQINIGCLQEDILLLQVLIRHSQLLYGHFNGLVEAALSHCTFAAGAR